MKKPFAPLKRCNRCGELKPRTEFLIRRRKGCQDSVKNNCILCARKHATEQRHIPENKQRFQEKYDTVLSAQYKKKAWDNPELVLLSGAKTRARKRGLEFNLRLTDIVIPPLCPILGIPLSKSEGVSSDGSPTLDRIDSAAGYVTGNVIVISWKANSIKKNATMEEMRLLLDGFNRQNDPNAEKHETLNDDSLYIARHKAMRKFEAKERGLSFSLVKADFVYPKICPILGIPIFKCGRTMAPNSPSLDRIDNSVGYEPRNVRIISNRANLLKNKSTHDEYQAIYEFYAKLCAERGITF